MYEMIKITFIDNLFQVSLILLLLCNSSSSAMAQRQTGDTTITTRIVTFPGGSITQGDTSQLVFFRNLSKAMELPDMGESLADLRLRIWLWGEDVKYVVNLEKKGAQFSCDAIGFNAINSNGEEILIIQNKVVNLQPQSGWSQISKKITHLEQVLSREPYSGRQGDMTGGAYVEFEIFSKGTYKLKEFFEPAYHRFLYKDALTIHEFLKTINEDFHLQAYMPVERFYAEPSVRSR